MMDNWLFGSCGAIVREGCKQQALRTAGLANRK